MSKRKLNFVPFLLFVFTVVLNLYFVLQIKTPQKKAAPVFQPVTEVADTPDVPDSQQFVFSNPLPHATVSSPFGTRPEGIHYGIDLASDANVPILSAAPGVVTLAESVEGYGNVVYIYHENGYETRYAHCNVLLVSVGDTISAGQEIARVGSTGNSTGPHLHFEIIKDGIPEDPALHISF